MTPPDDVSTRLSEIRERVEAATEGRDWDGYDPGDPPLPCEQGDHEPVVLDGVTCCMGCGAPRVEGVWLEDRSDV